MRFYLSNLRVDGDSAVNVNRFESQLTSRAFSFWYVLPVHMIAVLVTRQFMSILSYLQSYPGYLLH